MTVVSLTLKEGMRLLESKEIFQVPHFAVSFMRLPGGLGSVSLRCPFNLSTCTRRVNAVSASNVPGIRLYFG